MAKAYLLCGKVASGKTHYALEHKKSGPAVLLSCDDLFLELFDGCIGPEQHQQAERRAFRFFYGQAKQFLEMGLDVLLDFGFWTKESRDTALAFFRQNGLEAELLYFDPPDRLRVSRLKDRNARLQKSGRREYLIDEAKLAFLDQRFETPKAGEYQRRITD